MTLKFNELQQRLKEAKEKKIVFSFGRMNPPTIGHEKLVNKIKSEAKARGADARLYLSHTSNKEKDPLTYDEKAKYAGKAFDIFKKSRARTIIEVAKELEAEGYTDITLVFGEDRDAEMGNLIKKYNGKDFKFNSIDSVSAGKRDPKAKGVEGISGTKLRELAKTGKVDEFKKALASKLSDREKTAIYTQIRKVYSIKDNVIFDRDELREAYLVGELFNVGDIVYDMNENKEYEIIEQGPNFVYCIGEDGNVYTKWLSDLSEKKQKDDGDRTEVRQDKDIADKSGTQPAKYYAGLKSKSTKSARDAHFKKGAKKSDDDPSAYEPAPGDATAKTKPSTHTKKFKQMFGEASHKTVPAIADYPEQGGAVKPTDPEDPSGDWILGDGEEPITGMDGTNAKVVLNKVEKDVEKKRKSFKEHVELQEMPRWLIDLVGTYTNQRGYDKAQQLLQQILDRKAKEAGGMKKLKHDPAYYAAVVAKQMKGIDARVLARLVSEQTLAEAAEIAFEVEIEGIGTMLVAGANKQEVQQRLQKMFRDARKFSIGKRLMDPQIKMWYRSRAGDKPQVTEHYSRVSQQEEDEVRELLGFATKRPKTTTIVKKRKPEEPSLQDKIKARRKAGDWKNKLNNSVDEDEEWNIDLFLEEVDVPEPDEVDDEELEKEIAALFDKYDEIEDVADVYPDIDGDGIPNDQDDEEEINDDGEEIPDEDETLKADYQWEDDEEVDEALTPAQRFKRAMQMRRLSKKIQRARKIALKRMSSPEKLRKRARRHARNILRKRFTKGKPYSELGIAQKTQIEKFIAKKKAVINRLSTRLLPTMRRLEMRRLNAQKGQASKAPINRPKGESFEPTSRLIESNQYRVGSEMYYETFNEWKKSIDRSTLDTFDIELLESDIGSFAMYEGQHVPLDCPMIEEEKQPELNKPKAGGPKKYYVYVKDPSSGNIKKVSWGDTSGLKMKLNDPEARKSFAARHQCDTKKDKTKPGYWACRMPYYAKQLGLSGGGNFFW